MTPTTTTKEATPTKKETSPPPTPQNQNTNDNEDTKIQVSQEENDSEEEMYEFQYFVDDNLPNPKGTIANIFANDSKEIQINNTNKMANFLKGKDGNPADSDLLNISTTKVTFLVAVPDSTRQVRILYGLGTGCGLNDIGINPLEDHVLALYGDFIKGTSLPSALTLPATSLHPQNISYPSNDQLLEQMQNKNKQFWFQKKNIRDIRYATTPIVPVPTFLIYDGFHNDLDAMEVWERLQSLDDDIKEQLKPSLGTINRFLTATTTKVNKGDATVQHHPKYFIKPSTPLTAQWRNHRMNQLFPGLLSTVMETPLPPPPTHPVWTPQTIAEMVRQLQQTQPIIHQEEKKCDDAPQTTDSTLGLSATAYTKLLTMMGLSEQQHDEITPMWTNMNAKNMQKYDKLSLVRQTLQDNVHWREAKVQTIHQHLLMVVQRSFEGEAAPSSSLIANAKGLTVFAFAHMTDMDIDQHNELAEALASATTTTVKDFSTTRMKATTPTSFDDLLKRIKRFGNFLFAIFGNNSPLFMQVEDIIGDLEEYQEVARATMTRTTMTSILWILHIQSRRYAAGLMISPNALLPEFVTMCNHIKTKMPIQHGDVPTALLSTRQHVPKPNPRNPNDSKASRDTENPNKKQRTEEEEKDYWQVIDRSKFYHPKLKKAMEPFLKWFKLPMIKSLCGASRCSINDLFPTRKKLCLKTQFFGKCYKHCTFEHTLIRDDEASKIITLLDKVIKDPELAKVN